MNIPEIKVKQRYLRIFMKIVILCLAIFLWLWFYQPICDTSLPNCTSIPSATHVFIFTFVIPVVLIIAAIKMFKKGKR